MFRAGWAPLNRSDWDYCTCPPHPMRDRVMRSQLHPDENLPRMNSLAWAMIEETSAEFMKKSDEDRQKEFLEEHKRLDEVISSFFNRFNLERGVNVQ
jgi:hypothetical protein